MRYGEGDRESDNIEDRRSSDDTLPGGGFPGGGMLPMAGGGLGIGSMILIGVVCLMLGVNPLTFLMNNNIQLPNMPRPERQGGATDVPGLPGQPSVGQNQDEETTFVRRVLADTEDVWTQVFKTAGLQYRKPTLVLFNGATQTACGMGQTAMGPFYCPADEKVYIDLAFYDELKRRFHAPGDFAQAYVIAHEIGHHVQKLLGIADRLQAMKDNASSEVEANQLQVRMELQADCFAGVWASLNNQMHNRLQPGDIENGLNAAAAVGDDRLQQQAQGYIVPDTFTHGTSAQRMRWFKQGYDTGQAQACDTFGASNL